jgi:hypothetical protein
VPSPKGVPHYKLGMIKAFDVVGTSGAKLPEPDATVTARDRAMEVPHLQAGKQTLELKNGASRPREFELLSLKPGKSTEDVQAFMERGRPDDPSRKIGVPPGAPQGGREVRLPGRRQRHRAGIHRPVSG